MAPRKKTITKEIFVINCDVCGVEGQVREDSTITTCERCRHQERVAKSEAFLKEKFIGAVIEDISAFDGNRGIGTIVLCASDGVRVEVRSNFKQSMLWELPNGDQWETEDTLRKEGILTGGNNGSFNRVRQDNA